MPLRSPPGISQDRPYLFDPARAEKSTFQALIAARAQFGGSLPVMSDSDERQLSYDEIIRASLALGHALKRGTVPGEAVGIMLPSGAAAIIAFFAITAYGRVPAMINFTAGAEGINAALAIAKVRRIITARRFVALGKLDGLIAGIAGHTEIVYLEEVRAKLSLADKLIGLLGQYLPAITMAHSGPNRPAVILFTSGTEGEPKGVALTHRNLLSNVEQMRTRFALYESDILFNPLPIFHCFGLTVGSLLPIFAGIKVVFHPTPLQPKEIVRRIRQTAATILLSTDTFISQYARVGNDGDLDSLRMAVCGAERLRDETRALVRRKYAVELIEGYGVTEASPVIAANRPGANRSGTVGTLMPGMEARLEAVDGIAHAGRLFVKGPNVMLGYIGHAEPGVIHPLKDGWHDTGDIVAIDEDGFIAIKGRLKRFAKVGGETVSLAVVESCASALWPDHSHAAVALPDPHKGEQIVLVTTNSEAQRGDLLGWAHNHGVSELSVPRRIIIAEQIPTLGTGKTDYGSVQKLVLKALTDAPHNG